MTLTVTFIFADATSVHYQEVYGVHVVLDGDPVTEAFASLKVKNIRFNRWEYLHIYRKPRLVMVESTLLAEEQ